MATVNTQSTADQTYQNSQDLGNWLSTYGIVTVEKILDHYNIKVATSDLIATFKNPAAMLTRMIQTPLKNVFNGLVLQQAKDYQAYIEKLFIDYLLSGQTDQETESITMEDIEQARQDFLHLIADFEKSAYIHEKVIADSQTLLIEFFRQFRQKMAGSAKKVENLLKKIRPGAGNNEEQIVKMLYTLMSGINADGFLEDKAPTWARCDQILGQEIDTALRKDLNTIVHELSQIDAETASQLTDFHQIAAEVGVAIKNYRTEFAKTIKRVNELFYALGTYQPNPEQLAINQVGMDFDTDIG